jgi:uncharacterized DUF497 family protein
VKITFDPAKRARTLRERGLDFADAATVFSGVTATAGEVRFSYPERRFITAGERDGRLLVIVWTPVAEGRRIISMRHAHEREERRWRARTG